MKEKATEFSDSCSWFLKLQQAQSQQLRKMPPDDLEGDNWKEQFIYIGYTTAYSTSGITAFGVTQCSDGCCPQAPSLLVSHPKNGAGSAGLPPTMVLPEKEAILARTRHRGISCGCLWGGCSFWEWAVPAATPCQGCGRGWGGGRRLQCKCSWASQPPFMWEAAAVMESKRRWHYHTQVVTNVDQ